MRTLLFLIGLFLIAYTSQGQQLLQERSYQVNNLEKYLVSSAPAGQGNILFSGATLVTSLNFNSSYLMVKPNADTLWTRKGPENLSTEVQGIRNTYGGFLFYTSNKHPSSNITAGAVLQKLNKKGNHLWTQVHYDGFGTGNSPSSAVNMPDKGFLLGGDLALIIKTKALR